MAKRFGRNSKRKLLEQLRRVETERDRAEAGRKVALKYGSDMSKEVDHLIGILSHWAKRVRALAGNNSAFLCELSDVVIDERTFSSFRDRGLMRLTPQQRSPTKTPGWDLPPEEAVQIFEALCLSIEVDSKIYEERVLFHLSDVRGRQALVIDRETVEDLPPEQLAELIGNKFVAALRNKGEAG